MMVSRLARPASGVGAPDTRAARREMKVAAEKMPFILLCARDNQDELFG
jgi:hypothetical protein